MNRQPIHIDDPRLTDFALGEMSLQESKEFKQQISQSPLAKKELDAMEDIMALLTDGLKSEWADRPDVPVSLELLADPVLEVVNEEEKQLVVPMNNFGKSRPFRAKMLSLAAVLTGMLVVGSLVLNPGVKNTGRNYAASVAPAAVEAVSVDRGESVSSGPSLLLAEEVKDFDVVVADLQRPVLPADESYVDDNSRSQMVRTSYHAGGVDSSLMGTGDAANTYFPAAANELNIQLNGVKSQVLADAAGKGRLKTYTRSGSWSGSGRLGLISSYGGMQSDLADVLKKMEQIDGSVSASDAAQIRERLRGILDQSRKISSRLAH